MIKNRNPKNETTLKNIIFGKLRSNDEVENKQNFSKKAKTKNYKVKIAFKIVIKPGGCFIIIGLQEKKQSHKKSKTGIIHKLETAV